jgi:hypothetical protein
VNNLTALLLLREFPHPKNGDIIRKSEIGFKREQHLNKMYASKKPGTKKTEIWSTDVKTASIF